VDQRGARRGQRAAPEKGAAIETWEALLAHALAIVSRTPGVAGWSLGGGTVLMMRHHHRLSRGVDLFVPDASMIRLLSAHAPEPSRIEEATRLKLYLAQGEIDFVAAGHLTRRPVRHERILGRDVAVQTSAEILAKKIWYRAAQFSARDVVDLAVVARREPRTLARLKPVLAARRAPLLERLLRHEAALREDFAALDLLDLRASFDECLAIARAALGPSGTSVEEPRAVYRFAQAGVCGGLGGLALAGSG
jgi:hypothetical protein